MVYRNGVVFAALPRTKALYEEDAILMKFATEPAALARRIAGESRFAAGTMEQQHGRKSKEAGEGRHWRIFRMREERDVHGAIEWLTAAYRVAKAIKC